MTQSLIFIFALVLDKIFAEPKRYHPLVGFGRLADRLEQRYNDHGAGRINGFIAWAMAVLPWVLLAYILDQALLGASWLHTLVAAIVLYAAIGWQSLLQHAQAVATPLAQGDISAARQAVALIVSRDPDQLDDTAIAKAATESVLENGADAIFSALFWFFIAGIPGVVLYRLSNTLDAMWGYKTPRFLHFGWAAARIDDLLNLIPARLTALSYALCGHTQQALHCWRQQAYSWKSPNAGPVMAAGAGALNVALGGLAPYQQQWQQRPSLGPDGDQALQPSAASITAACHLVNKTLVLWVFVAFIVGWLA